MNGGKKRLIFLTVVFCLAISSIFLIRQAKLNNLKEKIAYSSIQDPSLKYSKELASFFPVNFKNPIIYNGTLEYGEMIKSSKAIGTKEELVINLKGRVKDESLQESNIEKLYFDKTYIVKKNYVLEVQNNRNSKNRHKAINKAIILKLPLVKGYSWDDKVEFDNKEYNAKTTITDAYNDKSNKKVINTETVIKNIKGYPNNTYTEKKIYVQGKGLVEFSNILLLSNDNYINFNYKLNR